RPLPVLMARAAADLHLLRRRSRADLERRGEPGAALGVRRLPRRLGRHLRDPFRRRRERRAPALRLATGRGAGDLASPLAAAPPRPAGAPARDLVERDAARVQLRQERERPGGAPVVLAARDRLPASPPQPLVPRRSRRHGRPLGRRLPPESRRPARARLVQAARLSSKPGSLRRRSARAPTLPRMAPLA